MNESTGDFISLEPSRSQLGHAAASRPKTGAMLQGGWQEHHAIDLYLNLIKHALTGSLQPEMDGELWPRRLALRWLVQALVPSAVRMFRRVDAEQRRRGTYWPVQAQTMIGMERLDNLQLCVEDTIRRGVPGDLLEAGVWRGGACILMRAVLKAY